jgi:glycosyl transferase family 87
MLQSRRASFVGLALLAGALLAVLTLLPPIDYRFFATAARAWRLGESSLYDARAPQFFYAPWSLLLLVPLSTLPDRLGQAIFNLITLASLSWGVWALARPLPVRALALALATPYTAAVLLLGQWDGLIVAGTALAWWAIARQRPWLLGTALLLITTKPTNALLVVLALLLGARAWSWGLWARALTIPLLALLASFLACGWDWPARYANDLRTTPPLGYNVSLWRPEIGPLWAAFVAVVALAWLVWVLARRGLGGEQVALVLVVNLLISPFVVPYHLVGTAPALAVVARRDGWVGLALWAAGCAAFLSFVLGWSPIPLTIYLALVTIAVSTAGMRRRSPAC